MTTVTRGQGGLVRTLLANVFFLSAAYLFLGLALEALRKIFDAAWAAKILVAMDGLPSRTLDLLGLLAPLREAYGRGVLDTWELRAIFSVATLLVIAVTAVLVGLMMAVFERVFRRRSTT